MIDRDHKLPLARQAKAVGISRGSIYYRPRSVGEAGLGLMRRIDELHLEYPFAGRLYRKPNTSAVPQAQHQPATARPYGVSVPAARA